MKINGDFVKLKAFAIQVNYIEKKSLKIFIKETLRNYCS